jgi:hypothetical protein
MSNPVVYVDTSEVRDGAHKKLKDAIKDLVEFIDVNEPQLIAYNVYLSDDGSEMTVVHVHADAASLEYHMEVQDTPFDRSPTSSRCQPSMSMVGRARKR